MDGATVARHRQEGGSFREECYTSFTELHQLQYSSPSFHSLANLPLPGISTQTRKRTDACTHVHMFSCTPARTLARTHKHAHVHTWARRQRTCRCLNASHRCLNFQPSTKKSRKKRKQLKKTIRNWSSVNTRKAWVRTHCFVDPERIYHKGSRGGKRL